MYSVLAEAKRNGSIILVGVLEKHQDMIDAFGKERCEKFITRVAEHEKLTREAEANHLTKYMTNEERQEFLTLSAPVPTF